MECKGAEDTSSEIYNEYRDNVRLTKRIRDELMNPKDVKICTKMLERYRELFKKTDEREPKILLNYWYSYFIKVLKTTNETQPMEVYAAWLSD